MMPEGNTLNKNSGLNKEDKVRWSA